MKAVIAGTVSRSPHGSAWHRKTVQPRPGLGHILRRKPVQIPARTGEKACFQRSSEPLKRG
jgi:hypothetical protein